MPNKNYIKGVRKERKLVNEARAKGLISFRSAGSHSPIDVITIDQNAMRILLVQCKPDNMSDSKKIEALNKMPRNGDYFIISEVV